MRRTCLKLLHSSRSLHSANTAKPASHTLRLAAGVRALNTSTTLQTQLQASAASISNVFTARYQELVGEGTIRHDEAQGRIVQRLAQLYDELVEYAAVMGDHNKKLADYETRRAARLAELRTSDKQASEANKIAAAQIVEVQPSIGSRFLPSWLAGAVGLQTHSTPASQAASGVQTERLAEIKRQSTVSREMGKPPFAPQPPKGLYVWGSVGSGKSLLMDLFFECVSKHAGLQHNRRMHFNAAMLEVHGRLHRLDMAHQDMQRHHEQTEKDLAEGRVPAVSAHDDTEKEDPLPQDGCSDDVGEDGKSDPLTNVKQGFLKYWDPEVQRQKDAKAATLAIRRHLMQARLGRIKPETLGQSNAAQLQLVASSFIRSHNSDVTTGWEQSTAGSASLLCFDEMQVSDVFSAVALKGIFEALNASGCVVVCTSNRQPHELPRHGLHESMWTHFVQMLESRHEVIELSSEEDYRRLLLKGLHQPAAVMESPSTESAAQQASTSASDADPSVLSASYLHPLGSASHTLMEQLWAKVTAQAAAQKAYQASSPLAQSANNSIQVMFGRTLAVSNSVNGCAWFEFKELCARPLGPTDYIAVAQNFHTVFISGVPAMSMQVRDQARRFITLVDELYNARVRLVLCAAVPPDGLFCADDEEPILDLEQYQSETAVEGSGLRRDVLSDGGVAPVGATAGSVRVATDLLGGMEERFAFKRAVSRLYEMQSRHYQDASVRVHSARV